MCLAVWLRLGSAGPGWESLPFTELPDPPWSSSVGGGAEKSPWGISTSQVRDPGNCSALHCPWLSLGQAPGVLPHLSTGESQPSPASGGLLAEGVQAAVRPLGPHSCHWPGFIDGRLSWKRPNRE